MGYGHSQSEETRKKISATMAGIKRSPETKRKMSESKLGDKNPAYGRPLSDEHKRILLSVHIGKPRSEETKRKIRESNICTHASDRLREIKSMAHKGAKCHFWKGGVCKDKDYMREAQKKQRHNRRARVRKAIGSFTVGEWELLKRQYGYKCPMCKKAEPEIQLTIDHVIPLSRGGDNNISNIQPLCMSCNRQKATKVFRINKKGELLLF